MNTLFCDGSAKFISDQIDGTVYSKLITPQGSRLPAVYRQFPVDASAIGDTESVSLRDEQEGHAAPVEPPSPGVRSGVSRGVASETSWTAGQALPYADNRSTGHQLMGLGLDRSAPIRSLPPGCSLFQSLQAMIGSWAIRFIAAPLRGPVRATIEPSRSDQRLSVLRS